MRHLGVAGRVSLHRVHTQPLRHIDRPVLCHHETAAVFEKTAVEKARVAHDTGRVARLTGHNVRSAFRLVGTHGLQKPAFDGFLERFLQATLM